MSERRCHLVAAGLLFALCLALTGPVLFSRTPCVLGAAGEDVQSHVYPWRAYGFGQLRDGVIPLWCPHVFCGFPYLAGLLSAIFYVPNWLFLVLPTHLALNASYLLHIWAAGLFAYLWMRELRLAWWAALLSGVTFMLSAPLILRVEAGHHGLLCTLAWLPLMLLVTERIMKRGSLWLVALGAVVLAMQQSTGSPQAAAYTIVALCVYFAVRWVARWRSRPIHQSLGSLAALAAMGIASLAVAAVQLLPTAEMIPLSSRSAMMHSASFAGLLSFPPRGLVSFIVPGFFGGEAGVRYWGLDSFWEMTAYSGLLPLLLAAVAVGWRRESAVYAIAAIGALALVLSFGSYSPLFSVLHGTVPGFSIFRGSSKLLVLVSLSIASLAGLGMQELLVDRGGRLRAIRWLLTVAVIVLVACFALAALTTAESPVWHRIVTHVIDQSHASALGSRGGAAFLHASAGAARQGLIRAGIVMAGVCGALVVMSRCGRRWGAAAALLVGGGDLLFFAARQMPSVPVTDCRWPEAIVRLVKGSPQPQRVVSVKQHYVNRAMADGLSDAEGYDANSLRAFAEYYGLSQGLSLQMLYFHTGMARSSYLVKLLNARYQIRDAATQAAPPGMAAVLSAEDYTVFEDPTAAPRAMLVGRGRLVSSRSESLTGLIELSATGEPLLLLSAGPALDTDQALVNQSPPPAFIEYAASRAVLHVAPSAPCYLFVSDVNYPGWRATVDRSEAPVLTANHAFRAIALEPGEREVTFYFHPLSFRLGAAVSVFTLAMLGCVLVAAAVRDRTRG